MILKANDLMQRFNDVVNRMMEVGCVLYPWTMNGHQGEVAKVDLMDEGGIYRVRLDSDMRTVEKHHFCYVMEITVERFDIPEDTDPFCSHSTLWKNKGEELYRKTFYEVDAKNYKRVWTDDVGEFCRFRAISNERSEKSHRNSRRYIKATPKNLIDVAAIVREHKGYTRVKSKDIREVEGRNGRYIIRFVDNKKKELVIG